MLNNSYFTIYNESFDIIYNNLNFYINDDIKNFKRKYIINNSKKITGYMLYVREYYKLNKSDKNSKRDISLKWEKLNNKDKEKYNKHASDILKYYNKMIGKKLENKENKKIIKENKTDNKTENHNIVIDYKLKKIIIDKEEYYIDFFNNLINIKTEEYIGFYNNNKIVKLK